MSILMWLFVVPFITALLMLLGPRQNQKRIAFLLSLAPLAILLYGHPHWVGSHVSYVWFSKMDVHLYHAVDMVSLLFLYLVAIIVPIAILAVDGREVRYQNAYYSLILLLQAFLIGFFTARDLAFFTIFWEGMLIPLYFIISQWGGDKKDSAAFKFLLYMIAGSALMIASVLTLYFVAGTFDLDVLAKVAETSPYAKWIFAAFLLAFAVKTPLFPFHGWLPDVYTQAPVGGTILLSALLSKAGIYGIVRIGMGLFPHLLEAWGPVLLGFAIAGVFYGGLSAWTQYDFKRLIAYSSFSHVNFVLAGLFVWSDTAHAGAILQALNHGVTIAALFLVAGWLQERIKSTSMREVSGLAKYLPHLTWLTLFFVLSSVALPGTNNFIGELLILFGLFTHNPWSAAILGGTVILSVIYMLRLMQKVYFEVPAPFQESWRDIRGKELLIATPLVALILWIGVYPAPLLKQILPAAEQTIATSEYKP